MEKNKVSIVLPVYNRESTLESCINSIVNQTYKNIEIIIVDDGSTDKSHDIINKFKKIDNRIIYIYTKNKGVSNARNIGINKSSGEYITFVDSDDMIKTDTIYKMVEKISTGYDFVRFNYYYSNEYKLDSNMGQVIEDELLEVNCETKKEKILKQLLCGNISTFVWALIIRKEVLNKLSPFNSEVKFMEDKLLYIDLFTYSNNYLLSNEPVYYYFYKDFEDNDYDYFCKYLKNANLVCENIKKILKKNNYFNEQLDKLVNSLSMSTLNEVIYKMYNAKKNMSVESIRENMLLCNKDFLSASTSKYNSIFSNLCIKLINKNQFKIVKIIYDIKKEVKSI
ncbi:MAG: glycosyltransferase family 2 protein [Clostridia bacterium]